jgi:hypothetical protein
MVKPIPIPTNSASASAKEHHAGLKALVEAGKTTGPKYAHDVVMKAYEAEWRTWSAGYGFRYTFILHHGSMRDGRMRHWRVTIRPLARPTKKGQTHRIEAQCING